MFEPSTPYWAETHDVENQPPALVDYNPYLSDVALQEGVRREGAAWAEADLVAFGQRTGSAAIIELGFQANAHKPEFFSHDRHGHRVDEVRFHPAYHRLMALSVEQGLHASHWQAPSDGAQVARAAKYYLMNQVEAGHGCPVTMTSAAIPTLRHQPDLFDQWAPGILSGHYDPSNRPAADKAGLTIGMAMTEKQGGSDVRRNSTRATPLDGGGPGQAYQLVGHKYFVSAPMCDAFLVLAQAAGGLSCFLLPRWRPDGSRNPLQIQRLKNKMGNVSNASSETELRGALAWLVGEEGRGVATIIDMVAMTRFDCMLGSCAGMRQAVAQALHHCRHREAFGAMLDRQPLMQNVLADLAVEQEAALALTLRLGRSLDTPGDATENLVARLGTAVGKYWICKRTPGHAYEAMECIGGSGVMEDCILPRLYREAPINAIWEGSGNVQCLDVLRALTKTPACGEALLSQLAAGLDPRLDATIARVKALLQAPVQHQARQLTQTLALAWQGSLLAQHGDTAVAEAFLASRLGPGGQGWLYGNLPAGTDCRAIIERAWPG